VGYRNFKREIKRILPTKAWDRLFWIIKGRPIPPPHVVKQWIVKKYADRFNIRIMIETGTYYGDMVDSMRNHFASIHSIEVSEPLYQNAVKKFVGHNHICLYYGDSGYILPKILSNIKEPALFWLDAHYSGGETGRGDLDTPIMKELQYIFSHPIKNHVILIDDARSFTGQNGYPTLSQLREFVGEKYSNSIFDVKDDIIRIHEGVID